MAPDVTGPLQPHFGLALSLLALLLGFLTLASPATKKESPL
jgi:hypothetical protein